MTTIIGTGEVGALHSREELEEMQRLPLQRKIQITTARIIEWYQHYDGKVYVALLQFMARSSELIGGGGRRQAKSVLAVSFVPLALTLKKLQTVSSV